MRISVIGCGYLGAVHAAAMASLGHDVVAVDVDEVRVASLAAGVAPFYEPRLPELLAEATARGSMSFGSDIGAVHGARVHFLCVGTPQAPGEQRADLRHLDAACAGLLPYVSPGDVVVGKSTVPVGTAERIAAVFRLAGATLVWNPEFLREGHAVDDTLAPDRIVYGLPTANGVVTPDGLAARAVLDELYRDILATGTPVIAADYATAELAKVAANSFLAVKISYINAMADLCDAAGGDVTLLAQSLGHDERIGPHFLRAGLGFGGGCLPKDIRAFMARAGELGVPDALAFLREVDAINIGRRTRVAELVREQCGGSLVGRRVAVLGAAFKPDSDDVRDSPALSVAMQMRLQGATVVVTDPQAIDNARAHWPHLQYVADPLEAMAEADVVLLATEWDEYRRLDPSEAAARVSRPRVVDARNALDPASWRAAGWTYRGIGRP